VLITRPSLTMILLPINQSSCVLCSVWGMVTLPMMCQSVGTTDQTGHFNAQNVNLSWTSKHYQDTWDGQTDRWRNYRTQCNCPCNSGPILLSSKYACSILLHWLWWALSDDLELWPFTIKFSPDCSSFWGAWGDRITWRTDATAKRPIK